MSVQVTSDSSSGTTPQTTTLVNPVGSKRFYRHYSGQPALYSTGTIEGPLLHWKKTTHLTNQADVVSQDPVTTVTASVGRCRCRTRPRMTGYGIMSAVLWRSQSSAAACMRAFVVQPNLSTGCYSAFFVDSSQVQPRSSAPNNSHVSNQSP